MLCGRRFLSRRARREQILTIARRSFLQDGYSRTSMSAIAAELGGSKGTLWSHFPSKDALFRAVLAAATASFQSEIAELLVPSASLDRTLKHFCVTYLTHATSMDAVKMFRLIAAEQDRLPEMCQLLNDCMSSTTQSALEDFFKSLVQADLIAELDPRLLARSLVTLCLGSVYRRLIFNELTAGTDEIEIEAESISRIILAAVKVERHALTRPGAGNGSRYSGRHVP